MKKVMVMIEIIGMIGLFVISLMNYLKGDRWRFECMCFWWCVNMMVFMVIELVKVLFKNIIKFRIKLIMVGKGVFLLKR